MLTCENCGVNFEEPDKLVEVTSLRVLCPQCTAERAAARARRAAPSIAPTDAPPVPAARPVPRASVSVETSAKPAQKLAARAPVTGHAPARARADDKAPPAPKPAQKTTPRPTQKKHIDLDTLASKDLQKRGSREVFLAFGSALLVLAVAGVVLWKVLDRKNAEVAAEKARLDKIERFHEEFMAMDMSSEEGATRLIAFGEENQPMWAELDFAPDVQGRMAKAKTYLQGQEERRTLTQRLEEIEQGMARAAELSPSDLAELRRRLDELNTKAGICGPEFVARVAKDREDGEVIYLDRLVASAQTGAATEPLDRTALTTIQQAEDEIFKIFNGCALAWQKNPKDPALSTKKEDYQSRYQALVRLSDETIERFFTPEVIENTPWRDLLSADQVSGWHGGTDVKGFERRIENGVMHLIGPDPSEKSDAVISIGDKEVWRDLLIDTEFTIKKGEFTIFFRLPPVWQENVFSLDMTTAEGALEAERSYSYSFKLIGSAFAYENLGEDSQGPNAETISWTKPRKGALGFSIPKDTEVKFTRLRVKVLR